MLGTSCIFEVAVELMLATFCSCFMLLHQIFWGAQHLFPMPFLLHTYPPPPRVQEPAMFDRGTSGRFLRMTVGSPVPQKKKFPARCAAACAPSPFPHLTTLTNEHQRTESQLTGL